MEFNVQPYNDDFELNAKENNYLKILFKPGYSVQARELTQIQSILQNQIKSIGDHLFQDGSPVIGGNLSLDNKISYIKLDETFNNQDIEIDDFVGRVIIRNSDSLVRAKVITSYFPSGGTPTLLIKYLTGEEFADGDTFRIPKTNTQAKLIDNNARGKGSVVFINDGIFYVDGFFIQVGQQSVAVDAYSQKADVKVGLEITQEVIDYLVDSTLLDPAQGSFNYQAPGADRYQFNLNLATRPLNTAVDESSFFELMRIENGQVTKQVKYPIYAELEKTLARRTYDESGDYTVTPFRATLAQPDNDDKYSIEIEPGKAYVKGFEFETLGVISVQGDKPRTANDTRSMVEVEIGASYGNYLRVRGLFGSNTVNTFIDTSGLEQVDLHCVSAESVNIAARGTGATANSILYSNTKIGTARIRNIKRYQAGVETTNDSNGIYNIYITDVNITPRIFLAATNSSNGNTIILPFTAPLVDNAYTNMTVSMLPVSLTPISNANVRINSTQIDRGPVTGTPTSYRNLLTVGDTIRIGDDVRQVVRVLPNTVYVNTGISFTYTSTGVNDPIILLQSPATSNVTGQKRTIVRYDGLTRTIFLSKDFDEAAKVISGGVVQINCGIKDVESIIEGGFLTNTTALVNASANILSTFKDDNGDVKLAESDYRSLIFRLPKEYIKRGTLSNVTYTYNKYLDEVTGSVVSGFKEFTVSPGSYLDASNEVIEWAPTNNNIEDNLICIIRNKGTSTYQNGQVLFLNSSNVSTVTSGIKITTDQNITSLSLYVIATIENATTSIRTKTLKSNTDLSLSSFNYPTPSTVGIDNDVILTNVGNVARINVKNGLIFIPPIGSDIAPGESINLWIPDVIDIKKIIKGNSTNYADSTNYQDITDNFRFNSGQTDSTYEHSKIILKQGYQSPNAHITVHCEFYDHNYTSSNTFFCVDSYPEEDYTYGLIPIYQSKKYGAFQLRDCLDFRSTKKIANTSNYYMTGKLPDPDTAVELSFQYFLPRIDKLVLGKNKEFKINQGVSAPIPLPPDDDPEAMTIYTIYMPPYVNRIRDMKMKFSDHRRYTMKDIAAIDKRIERIEYYTVLNSIESKAMDDQTLYKDSTKKEKYGIVGEDFDSFNVADYKHEDFNVSISEKGMTAATRTRTFNLVPTSATNINLNSKGSRTYTLNYTETPAVTQPLTSNDKTSVQPFLFATFLGEVNLYPEMDYWVSETINPEIIEAPKATQTIVKKTITNIVNEITNYNRKVTNVILPKISNTSSQITKTGEEPTLVVFPKTNGRITTVANTRPTVVAPTTLPPVISTSPTNCWQPTQDSIIQVTAITDDGDLYHEPIVVNFRDLPPRIRPQPINISIKPLVTPSVRDIKKEVTWAGLGERLVQGHVLPRRETDDSSAVQSTTSQQTNTLSDENSIDISRSGYNDERRALPGGTPPNAGTRGK